MDHLLNVKQASIILGLSPGTIRHYTECGLLPDVRNPHNCRVFRLDDLLRFKNSRIKFRKTGEMLGERLFRLSKSQGRGRRQ